MEQHDYIVDMGLFSSILMFPEALVRGSASDIKKQKMALLSLFQYANKNPRTLGKLNLTDLLDTDFADKKSIYQLMDGPLGNPVWSLFAIADRPTYNKFLDDLDNYIKSIDTSIQKSLKSLMCGYTSNTSSCSTSPLTLDEQSTKDQPLSKVYIKGFLDQHPEYGGVEGEALALGMSQDEIRARRRRDSKLFILHNLRLCGANRLGDIVTKLMLVQAAAIPVSKKEAILNGAPFDTIDTGECIRRPDAYLYMLALRGLAGTCRVDGDVFDEMVTMHKRPGFTNFLPFTPILLQWFTSNSATSHTPSINQIASIFGEYSGGTSHFMGDLTNWMNRGVSIEWKALGLGIKKLCIKKEQIPEVSLLTDDNNLRDYKIRTFTDSKGAVCYGQDLGWHIVEQNLKDSEPLTMVEIRDSLRSKKIKYLNFAKKKESLVFLTPGSRKRLDGWLGYQGKLQIAVDVLGIQIKAAFNKLPSMHEVEDNKYTVLPSLTRSLFLERVNPNKAEVLFTSGTQKESQQKNQTLIDERKLQREELKLQEAIRTLKFRELDRDTVIKTIEEMLEQCRYLEDSEAKRLLERELDEWFAELIERDLGITFPNLLGRKDDAPFKRLGIEPLVFRYGLGDLEVHAGDSWRQAATDNWSEASTTRPTKASRPVSNVWACISLIKAAKYMKADGIAYSEKEAMDYHICQRFPLPMNEMAKQGVLSLLPILYWVYFLQKPYRSSKDHYLLLPDVRITQYLQEEEIWNKDPKRARDLNNLNGLLRGHKLSKLSLMGSEDFNPSTYLERICDHLQITYDIHNVDSVFYIPFTIESQIITLKGKKFKETTRTSSIDVSRFTNLTMIKETLSLYIHELKLKLTNRNLAAYAAYTSLGLTVEEVWDKYKECKRVLTEWYLEVTSSLNLLSLEHGEVMEEVGSLIPIEGEGGVYGI